MRDDATSDALLTIGEFGRRARLTPKALRLYDEKGLLSPLEVDPSVTGGIPPQQADQARLIGLLRGDTDMPLAEIGRLFADLEVDRELAARRLATISKRPNRVRAARRTHACHIQAALREETTTMFEIQTRRVLAQRVMSI